KGLFTWSPVSGDSGAQRQITFSVTDGELEDTEAVTLVVSASAGDGPGLPIFAPIGEQVATVGESLSFQVSAESPGGVEAEIAMEVDPPPGSSLGSGLFTWTPTLAEVGQSWTVTFSATAEGLTAYLSVDILVVSGGDEVACTDDPGEPNGTLSTATPLDEGTLEASICDTDLVPLDSDVYAVNLDAGETLEITVEFDPLNGDLELDLVDQALTPLAVGNTVGSQETVTWTSSAATQVYAVVYGIGQSVFHAPYTLTLTTKTDGTCVDDVYEEEIGMPSLPGPNETLTLCPGDEDWWSVLLFCGESVLFTLDAGGTGDLDMYLWDPDSSGDGLLASGATGAAIETLEVPSVPHSGNYHLKVVGWPPGTGAGTYTLEMDYSGGCVDKGVKSNHKASDAWPLDGAEGALPDQRLCCDDDWYLLTLNAGQTGLVDVLVTSDGG
ncbi:MAG: hypothetical protein VX938_09005, partial [Myxococcota bacterium]|nr:hypothetical protein [Myxococcota bacterium]